MGKGGSTEVIVPTWHMCVAVQSVVAFLCMFAMTGGVFNKYSEFKSTIREAEVLFSRSEAFWNESCRHFVPYELCTTRGEIEGWPEDSVSCDIESVKLRMVPMFKKLPVYLYTNWTFESALAKFAVPFEALAAELSEQCFSGRRRSITCAEQQATKISACRRTRYALDKSPLDTAYLTWCSGNFSYFSSQMLVCAAHSPQSEQRLTADIVCIAWALCLLACLLFATRPGWCLKSVLLFCPCCFNHVLVYGKPAQLEFKKWCCLCRRFFEGSDLSSSAVRSKTD